ncbi:AMP-binding protein [Neptuniibacter caesariensis]|uniref:Long-chain-fatty-acid--CoA ligase n=1 Tax=Neptuniibacter caesariensis TaxID=207954 RepID=A0A7U8C3X6_NEPCE|nr:AMP-binding protein [Neptuniibacter caesariensis]EAR60968.1 acyl-CoA synthase [Oceanospirillum sp. MED92] [Neptuniibacter caesariensis]
MTAETDFLKKLQGEIDSCNSLVELWREACQEFAFKDAFTNMGASLTYAELDHYSDHLASYLQNCTDLKAGDRIAIQLPNTLQFPVAVLASIKAGLVVVNTNPLYTADETTQQFNDAGVKAVIVLANSAYLLEKVLPITSLETVIVTQLGDLHPFPRRQAINFAAKYVRKIVPRYRLKGAVKLRDALTRGAKLELKPIECSVNDPALIQYTVGTTGQPKGAVLSHRNLISNVMQIKGRLPESLRIGEEIAIAPLPIYHIYGFILNCLVMPMMGAQVVLITNPRDTSGFVNELGRWDFTVFSGINALFVSLCRNAAFSQLDMTRLKLTLSGGGALTKAMSDEWERITGCPIVQGYGLTEASPVVSVADIHQPFGSVGQPLPLTEVKIVGEQGEDLCSGETGELYVKGPQVMQGYWETNDKIPDSEGWLATGDIARLADDGSIRIVDRKKDIINISGFPVYPNELENIISSHPDVIECAVIGLPDDCSGEVVKLFVVTSNHRLSVKQVRDYCRERLTSYKVPRLVEFRTHLPKSNVGKVLRRTLLEEELNRLQKQRKRI